MEPRGLKNYTNPYSPLFRENFSPEYIHTIRHYEKSISSNEKLASDHAVRMDHVVIRLSKGSGTKATRKTNGIVGEYENGSRKYAINLKEGYRPEVRNKMTGMNHFYNERNKHLYGLNGGLSLFNNLLRQLRVSENPDMDTYVVWRSQSRSKSCNRFFRKRDDGLKVGRLNRYERPGCLIEGRHRARRNSY